MGRIRLAALFFALLCLLLYVPQEAAAQSPRVPVKSAREKDDFSPGERRGGRPPQPRPRGPEIFYCETPDPSCRTTQDTFSLAELRDLYVFVVLPGVSGQHVQTVQFYLPDGSVYSSKKTQFIVGGVALAGTAAPALQNEVAPTPPARHLIADANKIHPEGIPSLLMSSRGDSSILAVLPVAGTYITQRNLSGTWRVRVLLDDRFVLESSFTLRSRPAAPKVEEERER